MKILLAFVLLLSIQVQAKTSDYVTEGKCVMSYPMGMIITKRIDKKSFELIVESPVLATHALIHTMREHGKGRLNTGVKYTGSKTMKLEDGFSAEVDLWEECVPTPSKPLILQPESI